VGPPELLTVRDLRVWYPEATAPALAGLDLDVVAGECVAVLGPSGSGKSTLCRALLDLLPPGSRCQGDVRWRGEALVSGTRRWAQLRGSELGLVLQDHRHALDPVRRVGAQLAELVALHRPELDAPGRRREVASLLARVALDDGPDYAGRYPHQLSGGQRQRVNLAAALVGRPSLLLADEPTTALDLPVQRGVLALLARLVRDEGLALLLVTHDRDLVPLMADRVVDIDGALAPVAGRRGDPVLDTAHPEVRLIGRDLRVAVTAHGRRRDVVHGVSLELAAGEVVGLAGESGSGKTTLVRALAGWVPARTGTVILDGPGPRGGRRRRPLVQLVSQDAAAALDPQQSILAAVCEAARQAAPVGQADTVARQLLSEVDLGPELWGRRPSALSGGQRQRAQLARALAVAPWFVLADEPASSLDPRRRSLMLDLLARMRRARGVGVLVVSHDLAMLEAHCDRLLVMHAGLVVECYRPGGPGGPLHPASRALVDAAPARLRRSDLLDDPSTDGHTERRHPGGGSAGAGCPYASRCPLVEATCLTTVPHLVALSDQRLLRCPVQARRAR
jgi:peptide/nickel transport system ATP-binding protein